MIDMKFEFKRYEDLYSYPRISLELDGHMIADAYIFDKGTDEEVKAALKKKFYRKFRELFEGH